MAGPVDGRTRFHGGKENELHRQALADSLGTSPPEIGGLIFNSLLPTFPELTDTLIRGTKG